MTIDKNKLKTLVAGAQGRRKPVVLVVDDEPLILETTAIMLQDHYEVLQAESGPAALERLADPALAGSVCLVLSDQRMPEMTGVAFLRQVAERVPRAVRILVSGYLDLPGIVAAVNEAHIHFFLAKPANGQELLGVVRQGMELYEEGLGPYRRIAELERRLAGGADAVES
jgi:two-component system response regulator HupR/HoxA